MLPVLAITNIEQRGNISRFIVNTLIQRGWMWREVAEEICASEFPKHNLVRIWMCLGERVFMRERVARRRAPTDHIRLLPQLRPSQCLRLSALQSLRR